MTTVRDRGWVWSQFAVAGVLLVLSVVGILGVTVFDAAELVFSFAGAIHAFAVFPGLVLSLVLNGFIMRAHREMGLSLAEKWLLGIEFAVIGWLLVLHFWGESGDGLGLAIITWPVLIVLAIVIALVAAVRNSARSATVPALTTAAATEPPPPPPA